MSSSAPNAWATATVHDEPGATLTAVAAWGAADLAVGTSDGQLLRFGGPSNTDAAEALPTLRQRVRVSEHAVAQLCAAEACGVLVLLSDGSLSRHDLADVAQLRGAVDKAALFLIARNVEDLAAAATCHDRTGLACFYKIHERWQARKGEVIVAVDVRATWSARCEEGGARWIANRRLAINLVECDAASCEALEVWRATQRVAARRKALRRQRGEVLQHDKHNI